MIAALREIAAELRQPAIRPHALAERLERIVEDAEADRLAVAREAGRRRIIARALHEQGIEEERHDFRRFG